MMTTAEFLSTIFADTVNEQRKICIFTLPDRRVTMHHSAEEACEWRNMGTRCGNQNVYFGASLVQGNPRGRGKLANMAGIGGLWVDVDFADPGHKKTNLPPNVAAADQVLGKFPLAPSIIVHTGGGLHVYWIFKEPWIFDNDKERQAAALMSRRFNATLRSIAKDFGWDLDSVGDLTRVLRLPGTHNHKHNPPVLVKIANTSDKRYTASDFENLLIDESYLPVEPIPEIGAVILDPQAETPGAKFVALHANNDKFKRSWQRTRKDLQDTSPSGYDQSLANLAVLAKWSDQEIANLIIASRRHHGDNVKKALRWDYIKRTLVRARAGNESDKATEDKKQSRASLMKENQKLADNFINDPDHVLTPAECHQILKSISRLTGIRIIGFVKHGTQNSRYSALVGKGKGQWVKIGTHRDLLMPQYARGAFLDATGILIPVIKKKDWDPIVQNLCGVAEVLENKELTYTWQADQWVQSYLRDHPAWKEKDWREAAYQREPFFRHGRLYFHLGELRKNMRRSQGEGRVSQPELCEYLRFAGYRGEDLTWRRKEERMHRRFWWRVVDDVTTI